MPESTLEVLIRTTYQGQGMAAAKADLAEAKVIYGAQGQVLSDLGNVTATTTEKVKGHAKAVNEASVAEHDMAREGSSLARAMGDLGGKGDEIIGRFTSLAGTISSAGPMGIAIGGAMIGLGALSEGAKKVSETYDEAQTSIAGLRQASDAAGGSFEALNSSFEAWAASNASFIPSVNVARDDLAAFTRAGFDATTSMKAEGVAIDLAAIKHEDLATAGQQVLLMMEGQGRVAKALGIDIAALKSSDENAVSAQKELEKATTEVARRQDELTKALRAQKEEHDALAGKRKLSQHDLDVEADKAATVKAAQDALSKALGDQAKAQDSSNSSMQTAQQILEQLAVKTEGGRRSLSELEQQQDRNKAAWDDFSTRAGPAVNDMFLVLEGTLNGFIQLLDAAAGAVQWLGQHAGDLGSTGAVDRAAGAMGIGPRSGRGRAGGGPVEPGGIYTVGERGPETLVMGSSGGYVTPGAGAPAGGDQVTQITIQIGEETLASLIDRRSRDQMARAYVLS